MSMIMLDREDFAPDPQYQALLRYRKAVQRLLGLLGRGREQDKVTLRSFADEVEEIEATLAALCLECEKPAVWERRTQFSGNHPYCEEHAQQEKDFGKEDPSYFWRRIDGEEVGSDLRLGSCSTCKHQESEVAPCEACHPGTACSLWEST